MMSLNELRRRRALSLAALSERSGVAPKTINDVERGLVVPKLQTVRKLSEALAVEPTEVAEFARAIGLTGDEARAPE